jgi:hypothetical protein
VGVGLGVGVRVAVGVGIGDGVTGSVTEGVGVGLVVRVGDGTGVEVDVAVLFGVGGSVGRTGGCSVGAVVISESSTRVRGGDADDCGDDVAAAVRLIVGAAGEVMAVGSRFVGVVTGTVRVEPAEDALGVDDAVAAPVLPEGSGAGGCAVAEPRAVATYPVASSAMTPQAAAMRGGNDERGIAELLKPPGRGKRNQQAQSGPCLSVLARQTSTKCVNSKGVTRKGPTCAACRPLA